MALNNKQIPQLRTENGFYFCHVRNARNRIYRRRSFMPYCQDTYGAEEGQKDP